MKESEPPRWLLIGNSRWHWAWPDGERGELRVVHHPVGGPQPDPRGLVAWAATGAVPAGLLPERLRLTLDAVPLTDRPPWLGIDRALAGWLAWRRVGGPVLVADAGTVLSLTWVDAAGAFRGGRLMAGQALQLRAMAAASPALPDLTEQQGLDGLPSAGAADGGATDRSVGTAADDWPSSTDAAMRRGVGLGLAAAVLIAWQELRRSQGAGALLVCGGDGPALMAELGRHGIHAPEAALHPDLALQALARLRPLAGPQASPRSARI